MASDPYAVMTIDQERTVWQQAFVEQRERADSLFRAWVTAVAVLVISNGMWLLVWWLGGSHGR